jgi:predicted RNA binding protein YcfA (HicA-like mRNA interferase family)
MRRYCRNKDMQKIIETLIRDGWCYRKGGKHGRLTHPSGRPTLTVPQTPSGSRSLQNFLGDLRRSRNC